MPISLKKKEPISLKKMRDGLDHVRVGISWQVKTTQKFDVDLSAFLCENRKRADGSIGPQVIDDVYTVFYGNKESADKAFTSSGDDRGSEGGGSEAIEGFISKLDKRVVEVAFVATIDKYDVRNQKFGMCSGGQIFVENADSGEKLAAWDFGPGAFSDETALHVGSLFIGDDGWEFMAVGEGGAKSFEDIAVQDYGYPT